MQTLLRISDAAAIALHAADYLAGQAKPLSSSVEITRALDVSSNHLLKVLQQLTKAGLVRTARGPKGGFALTPAGKNGMVRDFITAIDGPPPVSTCLLKHKVCRHRDCMLGKFVAETNARFEAVLNSKISELSARK